MRNAPFSGLVRFTHPTRWRLPAAAENTTKSKTTAETKAASAETDPAAAKTVSAIARTASTYINGNDYLLAGVLLSPL